MHLVLKTVLLRVVQRDVVLGKACLSCSVLEQYEPNHCVRCMCAFQVLAMQSPLASSRALRWTCKAKLPESRTLCSQRLRRGHQAPRLPASSPPQTKHVNTAQLLRSSSLINLLLYIRHLVSLAVRQLRLDACIDEHLAGILISLESHQKGFHFQPNIHNSFPLWYESDDQFLLFSKTRQT